MTTDLTKPTPTVVKVSRVPNVSAGDLSKADTVTGYLVDVEGNDLQSPEIGKPICLAGDVKDEPWLFRTDDVYRVEVYEAGWKIMTEKGVIYTVENQRQYQ